MTKQERLESEYKKAQTNLEARIKRQQSKGYIVNREMLPTRPIKMTEEFIDRINNIKTTDIKSISTLIDLETGDILDNKTMSNNEFYSVAYNKFKSMFVGYNYEGAKYMINWFSQKESQYTQTELGLAIVVAQQNLEVAITPDLFYDDSKARDITSTLAKYLENIGMMSQDEYGDYVLSLENETWEEIE